MTTEDKIATLKNMIRLENEYLNDLKDYAAGGEKDRMIDNATFRLEMYGHELKRITKETANEEFNNFQALMENS